MNSSPVNDKKRPYSRLIIEPPENVKVLRKFKTLVEEDQSQDVNTLIGLRDSLIRLQELVDVKIDKATTEKQLEKVSKKGSNQHPLQENKVATSLMRFVQLKDLTNCRLVCKSWNTAASSVIKAKKILKLNTFAYKYSNSELTTNGLIRSIRSRSQLFPCTRFEINMSSFSQHFSQFLVTYSAFIKYLHLSYDERRSEAAFSQDSLKQTLTLNNVRDCEQLKITNFPCNMLNTFPPAIEQKCSLKVLDLTIHYSGTKANYFGVSSYYGKLMKSSPLLGSLIVTIRYDCKLEPGDIMQNVIETINNAEFKSLEHLSFSWLDFNPQQKKVIGQMDFTQLLPSSYKLKSLKLSNMAYGSLLPFLQAHKQSLEELIIHFFTNYNYTNKTFNFSNLSKTPLLALKTLGISGCLSEADLNTMFKMILEEDFPVLSKLKITELEPKFYKAFPFFNTTVEKLKIELNNLTANHNFQHIINTVDAFHGVRKLSIKYADQNILRNIWKTSLRATLTQFSMSEPIKVCKRCSQTSDYTYELDSIITGYPVSDCQRILTNFINKSTFFDRFIFDYLDSEDWTRCCTLFNRFSQAELICKSIASFENLRRLKISYSKGHITEVSMIYILGSLKKLTSLTIKNSSIRQYFVQNIRKSLGLAMHLDIECID